MFKTPTKTFKCSFLIILVVLENAFSSFLPYEFENDGDVESVVFTAEDNGKDSLGQLHLQGSSPQIIFQLRRRDNDTNYNRNVLVSRYVSRGMHPTIMFWNTSWSISFELNELVQAESDVYWKRNITVSELFHPQTQHNSFKRWNFIAELGKGLNLFQKKGSLIIGDAEPLLNLQFGDLMESNAISLQSLPNDVILRSSPCSSVVAGVVPLTNMSENPNSGCYFGVTHNYFSTSSIKWYNLLHLSSGTPDNHSLCKQSSFSKCSSLSVLDFALLRSHLLFVTTHGIMVSQSFEDAIRSGFGSKISFAKVNSVHPIIDKAATLGSLQRSDIQLFYTPHCYNNFVSDSKEEVCIVYNNGTTIVLCSFPPYDKWEQHGFEDIPSGYVVVSLVLDIQRKTKVTLVKNISKGNSVVQVYKGSSRSFPTFKFGNHETITGLYFHLYTSAIYAYGSQVWQSLDGGNSFHKATTFPSQDAVSSFSVDLFGETYSIVSKLGLILIGKLGIHRTTVIKNLANNTLTLPIYSQVVMDSKSIVVLKMKLNSSILLLYHDIYKINSSSDAKQTLQSTLLVNFKSETRVEFFTSCDCFTAANTGQVIYSTYGGSAVIVRVEKAPSLPSNAFKQHLTGYVLKPFVEVQANVTSMIEVQWSGWNASLTLLNGGQWQEDDVGKTIVLPKGQSFLLVHRINETTCIGLSYLPLTNSRPFQGVYEGWVMYDFRDPVSSGKATWWLKEDTCRSVLTEVTELRPQFYHLDSTDQLELTATVVSRKSLSKPIPRVFISNPGLFTIKSMYHRSHLNTTLKITIKQRPLATGSSPLTIVLENSSLFCRTNSLTVTVHSGCPPSKTMRYIYPSTFTDEIFLDSKAMDSKGMVRNFKLPYNYRPPSARGIAIPMTRNIYNVDQQKPHYRSSYAITRETVRYKQCAGAKERASCGCTHAMRRSSLVEHSDCVDTTYMLSFNERLKPKFLISREGSETESLHSPFYLEELNQRVDYVIINPSNKSVSETTAVIMEEKINSSIEFMGSGLYHFKAHTVRENYTFCELTAEFVVFIVETPLPYPVKDIVMACTAMGFSTLLFLTYLTYSHGKKKIEYD